MHTCGACGLSGRRAAFVFSTRPGRNKTHENNDGSCSVCFDRYCGIDCGVRSKSRSDAGSDAWCGRRIRFGLRRSERDAESQRADAPNGCDFRRRHDGLGENRRRRLREDGARAAFIRRIARRRLLCGYRVQTRGDRPARNEVPHGRRCLGNGVDTWMLHDQQAHGHLF